MLQRYKISGILLEMSRFGLFWYAILTLNRGLTYSDLCWHEHKQKFEEHKMSLWESHFILCFL